MLVPLRDAVSRTCGGKAGTLGVLLRAGLPVPDGFVVPLDADRADATSTCATPSTSSATLPVAVRSSADDEDTGRASAAGQVRERARAVQGAETGRRAAVRHLLGIPALAARGGLPGGHRPASRGWASSCSATWTPRCPG